MSIAKLREADREKMDAQPEVAMNTQIARREHDYVLVIAGRIAITYDEAITPELDRLNESLRSLRREGRGIYAEKLEQWTETLPASGRLRTIDVQEALAVLHFIHLGPRYPFASPPSTPPVIYGHLPFQGLASGQEVFYRYEPYPTSRRIDLKNNKVILPDTYASPELDAEFVNSGLGAVARYALKQLLPACRKYELTPPQQTVVYYGASVPLFGQSGGGVEVCFPNTFTNRVPIPVPTVLPIF